MPFVLLVLLFILLRLDTRPWFFNLDLTKTQLVIFPFFILWLLSLRIAGSKLPRVMLALAALGALSGYWYSYSYSHGDKPGIIVSRLAGDDYEIVSRVFREHFNRKSKLYGLDRIFNVVRYYDPLISHTEINGTFKDDGVAAVVWGSEDLLNISFPKSSRTFSSAEEQKAFKGLQIIEYVPGFALSREPEENTVSFLATLFAGMLMQEELTAEESWSWQESMLEAAARQESRWTSWTHRAYPLWLIGNAYLKRAVANGKFEPGELKCALSAYGRAAGFLNFNDNPELRAAIFNNKAIALALKAEVAKGQKLKRQAAKHLKAAIKFSYRPSIFDASTDIKKIVKRNLRKLTKHSSSVKKKTKKLKRRAKKRKGSK